jgi:polyhydroxyalkanoate synthesis regulator phasin
MDVERIQKVNNLALDLMKQGLAADREAAIKQAEGILNGTKGSQEYADLRSSIAEEPKVSPELTQDQISEILSKNTSFMVKTIQEFNAKITAMEAEISTLKSQLNSRPKVKEIVTQVTSENSGGPPESKEPHPRSGDYNDTDVSIEKYFYMGSK